MKPWSSAWRGAAECLEVSLKANYPPGGCWSAFTPHRSPPGEPDKDALTRSLKKKKKNRKKRKENIYQSRDVNVGLTQESRQRTDSYLWWSGSHDQAFSRITLQNKKTWLCKTHQLTAGSTQRLTSSLSLSRCTGHETWRHLPTNTHSTLHLFHSVQQLYFITRSHVTVDD